MTPQTSGRGRRSRTEISSQPLRLALVEILTIGRWRHFRNELFPFVLGLCREQAIEARWLRVGVERRPFSEPFLKHLPEQDGHPLYDALVSFGATHVVTSERLDPSLAARLGSALPGLRVLDLGQSKPGLTPLHYRDSLLTWLSGGGGDVRADAPGPLLVDVALPVYAWEPLDAAAATVDTMLNVVSGPQCHFARSVRRNPCFTGLDLARAPKTYGCSFCASRERELPLPETPLVELALRQVEAAARSPVPAAGRHRFLLTGSLIFVRLEPFLRGVLQRDLPPSEFQFLTRLDTLLRMGPTLEALLPELRTAGHRVRLGPMGVENFSPAENERFNKGVTLEQIVDAHHLMARLRDDFPGTFDAARHNWYGFILFTPWTTLDDLRTNLDWARRLGVPSGSNLLRTRLHLIPDMPLTLLAERDGLTACSEQGEAFGRTAILSWETEEVPWRFEHPRTALAYHVFSRLVSRDGLHEANDDLYEDIQRRLAALPRSPRDPFDVAEALLAALAAPGFASGEGAPPDVAWVLDRLFAGLSAPVDEAPEGGPERAPLPAGAADPAPDRPAHAGERGPVDPDRVGALVQEIAAAIAGGADPPAPLEVRPGPPAGPGGVPRIEVRDGATLMRIGVHVRRPAGPPAGPALVQLRVQVAAGAEARRLREVARAAAARLDPRAVRPGPGRDALLQVVEAALLDPAADGEGLRGLWPVLDDQSQVLVTLVVERLPLDLVVVSSTPGQRAFAANANYAISHRPWSPLDTEPKRRAVRRLLEALKAPDDSAFR